MSAQPQEFYHSNRKLADLGRGSQLPEVSQQIRAEVEGLTSAVRSQCHLLTTRLATFTGKLHSVHLATWLCGIT